MVPSLLYFFLLLICNALLELRVYRKQPLYLHQVGVRLHTHHPPRTPLVGLQWVCCLYYQFHVHNYLSIMVLTKKCLISSTSDIQCFNINFIQPYVLQQYFFLKTQMQQHAPIKMGDKNQARFYIKGLLKAQFLFPLLIFVSLARGQIIILPKLVISISEWVEGSIQRKCSSEIFHLIE